METVIFRKLTCRPPTTPLLKFPWNFQEMILKFNQSFNNLQMQKSSLSIIDKELFLCRRWESNPQGISTTRTWTVRVCQFRHFCVCLARFLLRNMLNYNRYGKICQEQILTFGSCPKSESNQRHEDFQSSALPTELSGPINPDGFTWACRDSNPGQLD